MSPDSNSYSKRFLKYPIIVDTREDLTFVSFCFPWDTLLNSKSFFNIYQILVCFDTVFLIRLI